VLGAIFSEDDGRGFVHFGNDWGARRDAAELYLKTRPHTRRRAHFESVIRAADRLAPRRQVTSGGPPMNEGGTPGSGSIIPFDFSSLVANAIEESK